MVGVKYMKKIIYILVITVAIVLFLSLVFFNKDRANEQAKTTTTTTLDKIAVTSSSKARVVPRVSGEARAILNSMVEYADKLPYIATNYQKNFFVIKYKKNVNGDLVYYVAVATGDENKLKFQIVLDEPIPADTSWGVINDRFMDFNDDGLVDDYVFTSTNRQTTGNDGFVILQEPNNKFILAKKETPDLLKYTSGPGVIPKFVDVDGDNKLEIIIRDLKNYNSPELMVVTKTIKLRGDTFYLWKTE